MSWDYFDRVYCIHLPNDQRRVKMDAQFERVGIHHVEYVHAVPPAAGFHMSNMRRNPRYEFGCSLSHIKAIKCAIVDGAERPLFVEDDIEFQQPERWPQALQELPEWDVLYFGGHPRGPAEMVGKHLAKVSTFSFAEAYALSRPDRFLDFWLDNAGQPDAMFDLILGRYAATGDSFCIYPLMTKQPVGYSLIGGKVDDKSRCLEKGWRTNLSTR